MNQPDFQIEEQSFSGASHFYRSIQNRPL